MPASDTPTFVAFWLAGDSDVMFISLAMLLIFASARLLAEVFERLSMPGIVGQILAGILIGPSVLGWMRPGVFLSALSELGVMFLLFQVGLEVKSSELMRLGGTALAVAFLGVLVPFFAGWGITLAWGEPQIESIFVGAAMVATSVGITAQVLASKGLLHQRASKVILAAAVIDDVLGLLVLAVVSSVAKGGLNFVELGVTSGLAVGFTFLVARFGTATVRRVMPRVEQQLRAGEAQFSVALVLLFALALLAQYAGVAAIIGAFLAGMALAESVNHRVHDLARGVTELLVPFFLVGIGLHFDLAAFAQGGTVILALVIVAAAMLSKFVGCGLGALKLGLPDAVRIGVGMSPRGEVGMVVAQIGLGLGVIAQSVYGVVVFMSIATTILAPPLLRIAYRDLLRPAAQPEAQEAP